MAGVVIVGSDNTFIRDNFTPKLARHGIEVLDHWDWGTKSPRTLPENTQAVLIMTPEASAGLSAMAKKAADARNIPTADIPRQLTKALPRIEAIGIVASEQSAKPTTVATATPNNNDIISIVARRFMTTDGKVTPKDLTRYVKSMNGDIADSDITSLIAAGEALYKGSFIPALEWAQMVLSEDVDTTETGLVSNLSGGGDFPSLTVEDFILIAQRANRKVFGELNLPAWPDENWVNASRPDRSIRKYVESGNLFDRLTQTEREDIAYYLAALDAISGFADLPEPNAIVASVFNKLKGNPRAWLGVVIRSLKEVVPSSAPTCAMVTFHQAHQTFFGKGVETTAIKAMAHLLSYNLRGRNEETYLDPDRMTSDSEMEQTLALIDDPAVRARTVEQINTIRTYFGAVSLPARIANPTADRSNEDPTPAVQSTPVVDTAVQDTDTVIAPISTADAIAAALSNVDHTVLMQAVTKVTGRNWEDDLAKALADESEALLLAAAAEKAKVEAERKFIENGRTLGSRIGLLTQGKDRLARENERLQAEIATLKEARDAETSREQVNNAAALAEAEARIVEMEATIASLKSDVANAENDIREVMLTNDALRIENENLRCRNADLTDEVARLQDVSDNGITLRELLDKGFGFSVTPPTGKVG